jgi:hypothetical protein
MQVQAEVEELLKGDLRQLLYGGQGQVLVNGQTTAMHQKHLTTGNGRGTPGASLVPAWSAPCNRLRFACAALKRL